MLYATRDVAGASFIGSTVPPIAAGAVERE